MSNMSGVDYAKRLGDQRDYFNTAIKRNRESSEKNIKDLKEAHDMREKELRSNYMNSKDGLEKSYNKRFGEINNESAQIIRGKEKAYQKSLNQEREQFEKQRRSTAEDISRKITNLKEDFNRTMKRQAETSEQVTNQQRDGFQKKLQDNIYLTEKHQQKVMDNFNEQEKEVRTQLNKEKQDMLKRQHSEVESIVKDSTNKELALSDIHRRQLDQSRRAQQQELEQREKTHDQTLESQRGTALENLENVKNNFSSATERIADQQKGKIKNLREENRDNLKATEKKAAENAKFIRQQLDFERRMKSGDRIGSDLKETEKNSYKNTINAYKRSVEEVREKLKDQNAQSKEDVQRVLRDRALDHSDKTMTKDREHASFITKMQESNARELDKLDDTYKRRAKIKENRRKEDDLRAENRHKKQVSTQNKVFSQQFNTLRSQNEAELDSVRQEVSSEKAKFIVNTKRRIADERQRMMEQQQRNLSNVEEKYATRFNTQENAKLTLEEQLHEKLRQANAKSDADTRYYADVIKSKEEEHNRTLKSELALAARTSDQRVRKMRREFDDKIRAISHRETLKNNQMIESYENRIKLLTDDFTKRLRSKDEESKKFSANLMNTHKIQRENLITKYETRIKDLTMTNEMQMERLKLAYRTRMRDSAGSSEPS